MGLKSELEAEFAESLIETVAAPQNLPPKELVTLVISEIRTLHEQMLRIAEAIEQMRETTHEII